MTLVFHPSALRDLRRIALWYRKHRLPPYEARFFERLRTTLRSIEHAPASFVIVLDDMELRRARILRSPYAVHFVVRNDNVRIIGVVHGARDPATWERRAREEPPE
jgi:plasmid stabilization system protein ParE